LGFEDTEDLVTSYKADLGDAMRVTEGNTDLRWCKALAGEFDDLVNDFLRSGLQPGRG
jgi:predicted phosphohydrolase